LAEAGASVAINYRNKASRAEKLVADIEAAGGSAMAIGADLTDSSAVSHMIAQIRDHWGGLDILVLNASGGMEAGMGEDYAMKLNRDAQVGRSPSWRADPGLSSSPVTRRTSFATWRPCPSTCQLHCLKELAKTRSET
jgi:NAD(P)-dependent dehydrogenase (short-subunit alcohol dehydrogenase family)